MVLAQFWTDVECQQKTVRNFLGLLEGLAKVDPDLYGRHKPIIMVCFAATEMLMQGDVKAAMNIAKEAIEGVYGQLDDQPKVTAQLVLARVARMQDDVTGAEQWYTEIIDGDHHMEQVRAIAKREIKRETL